MKRALLIFITLIVYTACSKSKSGGTNQLLLGKWAMVAVENLETGETIEKNQANIGGYCANSSRCDVVLELLNVNNKWTVEGHTITNSIFGEFIVGENSSIQLNIGMSEKGDALWSGYFTNNLYLISTYEANHQWLYLYFKDMNQRLVFTRQ